MPTSTADLLAVVRAARSLGAREHIVLGMGEFGTVTRILQRRLGNLLTFASSPGAAAAPGHLDPRTLAELYRTPAHHGATRLFAVIGNPIAHSKSPEYHNGRFIEDGIDATYVPVLVDDVAAFFELAEELGIL
ncbi:MAG: type I 3-dehydroquinate dehydratase, partial [Spirochaetota bacterium]